MKKLFLIFTLLFITLGLASCKEDPTPVETIDNTIDATLLIDNITITKGENVNIDYQITPAGTFGVVTFEIVSSTPAYTISITGTTLTALEAGTASVKATATNMSGASKTFSTEKTFTVTVNPIPVVAGQFVLNGGFEFGMNEWTVESLYGDSAYGTAVVDNYPHSGEAALNLWYDDDLDELSDPLDLKIGQTLSGLSDGTYLFSLWYQGTATSITMTTKDGQTILETKEFSGYDYSIVPNHDGYVNYGFEVVISGITSIQIEIHILGAAEAWGYLDDVSFKLGTIDDLEVAPKTGEQGFVNFVDGGNFASLDAWTVEITGAATNKTATLSSGRLSIWADGVANFKVYQEKTLIEETYNLVIYLNGGAIGTEFNADDAYAYVKMGETVFELELTPEGWNGGELKRVELSDISLSGTVEIGIHINFTGGSNNWINLDNFSLWSYEIEVSEDDVNAALAVDVLIDDLPSVTELTVDDEDAVQAARTAYDLLTPLQKSYVLGLSTLIQLEEKLNLLLTGDALDVFNTEGTFQAGDSWLMSAVNWTVTAGNTYVTDWGYNSTQSYNVFKDQSILTGSIEKELALEAGDYEFSVYIAGGGLTSFSVKIGDITENITITSAEYTKYSFEFSVTAGTYIVEIEMVRPDTNGWVHIDDVKINEVLPSALDLFNEDAQFESSDWTMATINWTVTGGNAWTDGDWPQAGTQSYNFFKNVSTLEASITRDLFLEANTYTVSLYFAGGDLTSLTMSIGDHDETFIITSSYALYTFEFTVAEGTYPITLEAIRPTTAGWVHVDNLVILVKDVE